MSTFTPNDPLWTSQWYLNNTGQRGGAARLDLKLMAAWSQGFNGQGVRVAINDDGFDLTHPDLVANIDASKVYDTNRDQTGKGFVTTKADAHEHGTVVGSIVGMAANGMGGIGIAYKATLIPGIAVGILDDSPANAKARLFAANLAAGADVSVNSWGKDEAFQENFGASGDAEDRAWGEQLLKAATEGRAGLGRGMEVPAGSERENRAAAGLMTGASAATGLAAPHVKNPREGAGGAATLRAGDLPPVHRLDLPRLPLRHRRDADPDHHPGRHGHAVVRCRT